MESFAQTGAQQDDLFDDVTYTNGEESMQTRAPENLFDDDFTPVEEPVVEQTPPQISQDRGGRGQGRGRSRGRGGPPRGRGNATLPQEPHSSAAPSNEPPVAPMGGLGESRHAPPSQTESKPAPRPNAVRGDRLATGGMRKPKLTDEELAEKMNRISLKNASLEAAHARAEADAASFAQREDEASKRRKEERKDRQQMMGEREKNRLRKLKAQEGREWDVEKKEEDFTGRGGRGFTRGAHGGVAGTRTDGGEREGFGGDREDYTDGREYIYRENRGRGRGRGGERGRGQGRGRGGLTDGQARPQAPPKANDFPDLPAAAQKTEGQSGSGTAPKALSFPSKAPATDGAVQAEQGATETGNEPAVARSGAPPAGASNKWADMVEE